MAKATFRKQPPATDGAVYPKTEAQWKIEGFTEEEIRAFSVIGLVLINPKDLKEFQIFQAGWNARDGHMDGYRGAPDGVEEAHIIREFSRWQSEQE